MSVLVDTHIWIWWLTGQDDLPEPERTSLDQQAADGNPPLLSAISLWEAQMLASKGRLALSMPFSHWLMEACSPEVVQVVPIVPEVILCLDMLPAEFHGDPADRLVVASALSRGVPLHTHDKKIRAAHVSPLWQP